MTYGIKDLRKCVVNHSRILRLYQDGNTITEISRLTGYSRVIIRAHLQKSGIYRNPEDIKKGLYNNDYKGNLPPALIAKHIKDEGICQEYKEKILDEELGTGGELFEQAREEEPIITDNNGIEIIEADTINGQKEEEQGYNTAGIDRAQIKDIDKVINHCLKLLKDKDRLKKAKTSVLGTLFSVMVEKKKLLQGLDPKYRDKNQFIINFFANRDFVSELKRMKELKEKQVNKLG